MYIDKQLNEIEEDIEMRKTKRQILHRLNQSEVTNHECCLCLC